MRLESVSARYDRLLVLATDLPGATRLWARVLFEHPTALRELKNLQRVGGAVSAILSARREAVLAEQDRLRAAAPLPPPPILEARIRPLAIADAEWVLRELRALARLGGRKNPAAALAAYHAQARTDPVLWSIDLARTALGLSRRSRQLEVLEGLGARYGYPALGSLVLGSPSAGSSGASVDVGASGDLRNGGALRVEAFGQTIAVFRYEDRVYALADTCPHRGGALGRGEVVDGCVLCPLHGWAFELSSGAHRDNPGVRVARYAVREVGGRIRVLAPEDERP